MKTKGSILIGLAGLTLILFFVGSAAFAVPTTVNYQGYLTDSSGVPVSGTVSITFRIYDAATHGALVWSETQDVDVNNGVYSVELGSGGERPLDEIVFTGEARYLEVEIDGTPLSPRLSFTSNAYAVRAGTADSVPNGSVSTIMVADGAITAAKLAVDSVGSAQIAGGAVNTSEVADGAITAAKLATDSVGSAQIAGGAVNTSEVANGAITSAKISAPLTLNGSQSQATIAGTGYGVYGQNTSTASYGYLGQSNYGVYGNRVGGSAVVGESSYGNAVTGDGGTGTGVYARGGTYGLYGYADIVNGTGVYGYASGDNGKGVYGYNTTSGGHAGYFVGDVAANNYEYRSSKTYYKNIPPSAFRQSHSSTEDDNWFALSTYAYIDGGTSPYDVATYAPVYLPEGATANELRCYYYDNDVTADLDMSAYMYKVVPTGGSTAMASVTASSSGISTATNSAYDYFTSTIDNASNSYVVYLHWSAGSTSYWLRFKGCRIKYTVDTVAP